MKKLIKFLKAYYDVFLVNERIRYWWTPWKQDKKE